MVFNNSVVKLLTSALELDLQDDEMVQSLLSDEFIKQVYGDEMTANKMIEESYSLNINSQTQLLQGLLTRTDLSKDSEYKTLAKTLISKV